jgi:hypothetical protein
VELDGSGRSGRVAYSAAEEEEFRKLAASPDCYERIARSIAPSIFGAHDIKKAIACLLFAGEKRVLLIRWLSIISLTLKLELLERASTCEAWLIAVENVHVFRCFRIPKAHA